MRLFLQNQAGMSELNKQGVRVRVEIPGDHTGNGILMGQNTIARSSTLILKPQSHQRVRYYDPSHAGQRTILSTAPKEEQAPQILEVIATEEELNLQGFGTKEKMSAMNPFADIGIIYENEDVIAGDEDPDDTTPSNSDLNAPSLVDPDVVYAELLEKGVKNYGISKMELGAFSLTLKQVKALYVDVTGKQPTNITSGKMKRRIRDLASQSYSDYTRVISAIEKVIKK